jgi:hypothetical protein
VATWTAIENAIHAWVLAASGLATGNIIFAEQDGSQPAGQFITIRIGDLIPVGIDAVTHAYNAAAVNGSQITQTVTGLREFTVSIQCFDGAITGASTPREVLANVWTALSLPTRVTAFKTAGISAFDGGSVRNVAALREDRFEARALLEVRFYTLQGASETTTWIQTAELDGDLDS